MLIGTERLRPVGVAIFSIVFAIVASSVLLALMGTNPVPVFSTILSQSFTNSYGLSETLVKATPILFCALAVAVPAWVGLMNIGAEGQLHAGAIGGTWVALSYPGLPALVLVPAMLFAGFVSGAVWAGFAGLLKAKYNVNEVMVTLLSNFIALLLVDYLVHGPWKDPTSFGWPQTAAFSAAATFPTFGGTRVHLGLPLGLAAAVLLWALRRWTTWGLTMKVIHANPETATYAGFDVRRSFLLTMLIAGGLAALAGTAEVSAIQGRLRAGISPGYGYTGILVSWLADHHPLAIIVVAFFIGGLLAGGDNLQITFNLPFATVNIVLGLIFFFLLVGGFLLGPGLARLRAPWWMTRTSS